MVEGVRDLSGASFIRVLIPFTSVPPSCPNHIHRASPPNIITLAVWVCVYNLNILIWGKHKLSVHTVQDSSIYEPETVRKKENIESINKNHKNQVIVIPRN